MFHLQSMLKRAQERIGLGQIGALLFRNEIAVGKPSQTDYCVSNPQPFIASAVCQLQRLCDELNFPDAAALEFYVESHALAFDAAIDLLLRQTHTIERILN